ncbi:winged helix-turn-helix domain-containing protein [Pseudomonas sp. BBP2017]|uniref:winged helix-turn-helix domain-containing protein n=1 Tax=Pseudomonas sp. BBP2017 TaxID=2109731 RepID=UPI000D11AE5F|nr:winged helix-turn-helix domain-containing protein [Pseudomonas sp. BBP2017]PSS48587.1 DNA-binding protein [Pseudomonas sp. BBP2017]
MIYNFRLKNSDLVEFNSEHCKIIIRKQHAAPEELTLARAESRILELLLMEPGAICSREAILEFAWDDRVVSAGSLNQSIFMLRNILGDGKDHEIVITVPRRGYRFNSDQVVAHSETAAASVEEPLQASMPSTIAPTASPDSRQGMGMAARFGYLAAAVLTVLSIWRLVAWYEPVSELHVAVIKQGKLSISAVGKSEQEVNKLKSDISGLVLPEESIKGQVFISRKGSRVNMSCIRTTGRTFNFEFQLQDEQLVNMLKKCVSE